MNLSNELYISIAQIKDKRAIKDSLEKDNSISIYENIERIYSQKSSSNMDMDIHLLLSKLI